ncbi:hypothetical protein [Allobranchiibius sp. CTAmp26]|uniref:hypothetical protein n=1 Tax=Allobranchiibius sp. CTAmp26 TaxID=2815214 RepID=UPI001AA0B81D|nr:hypothetical protein [Allobranchiibius sp. CTAmp26]MBO1756556.1 hypothetical protein [Allobranchiibius sp. CTAmp26]
MSWMLLAGGIILALAENSYVSGHSLKVIIVLTGALMVWIIVFSDIVASAVKTASTPLIRQLLGRSAGMN